MLTGRGPLRPSSTCTRGQGPWTHLGDIAGWGKQRTSACFAGGTKSLWASGPRKAGEILRGRASFPPQDFPCFHRMLCIRDGDFVAGPEAITAPSQAYFLSTAGVCFFVRPSSIRLCGSRGIIPLVRSGLKAQRIPFVCLPIVASLLRAFIVPRASTPSLLPAMFPGGFC